MKIWRPYTQMHTNSVFPKIVNAKGSYLQFSDSSKCLDGISSWWLITHGHCHPQIIEAVQKQTEKVDQIIFANFSHDPAEILAEEMGKVLPSELDTLFFSDNGSTAVEVAMKMALQFWNQSGLPDKNKFLTFECAYHGDTSGAMSVSGESHFNKPYKKIQFDVLRAKQGRYLSDPSSIWLSDFKNLIEQNHKKIAAVILEPLLQGAGGMIIWPAHIVNEIAKISKEKNVLIIFDEVMTGFGRTGSMFAFEQTTSVPDFLCLSKGLTGGMLPLAVTVTKNKIYEAFLSEDSNKMLFHGHSFTANPISCAAACANLKIFQNEQTISKIKLLQNVHETSLKEFSKNFILKDTRSIGAVGVLELTGNDFSYGDEFSRKFMQKCLKKNLFVRSLGAVIYLMPPYSTEVSELKNAWETIQEVLIDERN